MAGGGYITSVWRKNSAGEWRVLADVGISARLTDSTALVEPARFARKTKAVADTAASRRALLAAEQAFAALALESPRLAYQRSLSASPGTRLYRNRKPPTVDATARAFAEQQVDKTEYTVAKAVVAASGDLGFTYGYGNCHKRSGPFIRIWRNTGGQQWKIVHEVLDLNYDFTAEAKSR